MDFKCPVNYRALSATRGFAVNLVRSERQVTMGLTSIMMGGPVVASKLVARC